MLVYFPIDTQSQNLSCRSSQHKVGELIFRQLQPKMVKITEQSLLSHILNVYTVYCITMFLRIKGRP